VVTAGIVNCSPYGMVCTECNELVIAPEWSVHVSKREARHFWRCENCGHAIELPVNLSFGSTSRPSESVGPPVPS
jgi:RNase P subunit RPR2